MRIWALCLTILGLFGISQQAPADRGTPANPLIWIFETHLTGAANQRLGVAKRLSNNVEILKFAPREENVGAEDFMKTRLGKDFAQASKWPDLILHTEDWAHELDFLLDLKKIAPKPIGLVYLENPKKRINEIDLVVVPTHQPVVSGRNILRPIGVASSIDQQTLSTAADQWRSRLAWMPRPLILVALGGDTLANPYHPEFAKDLGERLKRLLNRYGGSLLITTTRRTPENSVLSELTGQLWGTPMVVYDWTRDRDDENPYVAGLALATHIVATGDSMSMLSDAVYVGKPLYIHAPVNSILPEHSRLIEDLYVTGRARPLTGNKLEDWTYPTLDVAGEVAAAIRQTFPCEKWLLKEDK